MVILWWEEGERLVIFVRFNEMQNLHLKKIEWTGGIKSDLLKNKFCKFVYVMGLTCDNLPITLWESCA